MMKRTMGLAFGAILSLVLVVAPTYAQAPGDSLHPISLISASDSVRIPVLDFKNTDVRDILRALGMQYNVNVYVDPAVEGKVSLYLTNVTVRNAIDFITRQNNLAYEVKSGIVRVFKPKELPPPPPPKPVMIFHFDGKVLEIDIKDVPARDVARMFTDSAKTNVVVEGTADKLVTGRLSGLTVDKAVKMLFESAGYVASVSDGVYYVSPKTWGGDQTTQGGAGKSLQRLSITVNSNRTVSMEVDNAALDQAVRSIAVQSGINVIIYDQITGTITAKFDSIAIDDVLRFLLQNTKFTFWKDRDIYFIGSREMSQQKTSLVIPLRHIMADEAQFNKVLPPHISKVADIKYDKEHNAVIVIGSFDVIAQAQEYIEKLDRPIPQVLIEALVVDFNINKIREFGVSMFTQGASDSTSAWNSEQFLPNLELKPGRKNTERVLTQVMNILGLNRVVNLPTNFRSIIQALETADVVKVHSTPQIATINGNTASITIGETRYYKLRKETRAATNTNENVLGTDERFEKVELNTKLEVTPWVMDQGYVMVKIRPEFQIPRGGADADRPPTTDTRVLESMVRLRNGQSIVLGGQRQTGNSVSRKGIPFLSAIPIIGFLFSQKTVTASETQMMIFLTPHVYYGDEGGVKPEDFVGTEIEKIIRDNDPDRFKKRSDKAPADSSSVTTHKKKREWSILPWKWKKKSRDEVPATGTDSPAVMPADSSGVGDTTKAR